MMLPLMLVALAVATLAPALVWPLEKAAEDVEEEEEEDEEEKYGNLLTKLLGASKTLKLFKGEDNLLEMLMGGASETELGEEWEGMERPCGKSKLLGDDKAGESEEEELGE